MHVAEAFLLTVELILLMIAYNYGTDFERT